MMSILKCVQGIHMVEVVGRAKMRQQTKRSPSQAQGFLSQEELEGHIL